MMKKSTVGIIASAIVGVAATLGGCRDVEFEPKASVPLPLIEPFPASVGVYYSEDFLKFAHNEERWGSDWTAKLGADHERLLTKLFDKAFRSSVKVKEPKAADSGVNAVLRPIIEQFSFITPRDTGGGYFAVTIKYRLEVYAPDGQLADTLAFTGYGSAPSKGFSSGPAMQQATQMAMRDAAAKFLVQFPEQSVAKRLRAGEPLLLAALPAPVADPAATVSEEAASVGSDAVEIEPVPIIDTPVVAPSSIPTPAAQPPVPVPPPAPSPEPQSSPPPPAPPEVPTPVLKPDEEAVTAQR